MSHLNNNRRKSILVLGACGFLGCVLVAALLVPPLMRVCDGPVNRPLENRVRGEREKARQQAVEMARGMVRSSDPEQVKEGRILEVLLGERAYDPIFANQVASTMEPNLDTSVGRIIRLCFLAKFRHAALDSLLKPYETSGDQTYQMFAKWVREDGDLFAPTYFKNPAHRRTVPPSQIETAHLDKLAEIANGVFHGTVKYSPEVGDVLAKRFYDEDNGGSERLAIAKALKKHGHPGYAKALDWLRNNPEEAYRLLVPVLEKPGGETNSPAK